MKFANECDCDNNDSDSKIDYFASIKNNSMIQEFTYTKFIDEENEEDWMLTVLSTFS